MALAEVTRKGGELTGGIGRGFDRWRLPRCREDRGFAAQRAQHRLPVQGHDGDRVRMKYDFGAIRRSPRAARGVRPTRCSAAGSCPRDQRRRGPVAAVGSGSRGPFAPGDKARRLGVTTGGSVLALIGPASRSPRARRSAARCRWRHGHRRQLRDRRGQRPPLQEPGRSRPCSRAQAVVRQNGEVRKLEHWYIDHGSPSKYLDERLVGAHRDAADARRPEDHALLRPGTDEILARRQRAQATTASRLRLRGKGRTMTSTFELDGATVRIPVPDGWEAALIEAA